MFWPFNKSASKYASESDDSNVDPSLKEFYDSAKPLTPVSLAPQEVKEEYEATVEANKSTREDIPSYREEGLNQIDSHGVQEVDLKAGKNMVPLGQAARNNCVEYEALMANCSLKGTYWEKLNMCHIYRKQQMRCVELQTEALKVLGYGRAWNRQQQIEVQNQVDDLFSQTIPEGNITDEISEKFEKVVEKERVKRSELMYRV